MIIIHNYIRFSPCVALNCTNNRSSLLCTHYCAASMGLPNRIDYRICSATLHTEQYIFTLVLCFKCQTATFCFNS